MSGFQTNDHRRLLALEMRWYERTPEVEWYEHVTRDGMRRRVEYNESGQTPSERESSNCWATSVDCRMSDDRLLKTLMSGMVEGAKDSQDDLCGSGSMTS